MNQRLISKFLGSERLIHSIKTAIACLIGFALTKVINFPADQWVIITILIIMCAQIYVGSALQKSYLRFLGTLLGCLFAAIPILTIGVTPTSILMTLCLSGFVFSYVATSYENLSYACTLGAATTAIIMLGQQPPTLQVAVARFIEISIGILIAALISQFILPIHARTHLRRTQALTLAELKNHYITCLMRDVAQDITLRYEDSDEIIVKILSKQRQLAKEAVHEPLGTAFSPKQFMHCLHCEKEILRAIDFMHNAILNITKNTPDFLQSQSLHVFHDTILQTLHTMQTAIETNTIKQAHIHTPVLQSLKTDAKNYFGDTVDENTIQLSGFLFGAELLTNSLQKLATFYGITVMPAMTE